MAMHLPSWSRLAPVLAAAALGLGQPAMARNDAIIHPIAPVLNADGRALMGDLHVAFGASTAGEGTALTAGVEVHGIGSTQDIGYRKPTDAEVCDRALLDALNKLALAARKAGANGIVGIVSNYQGRSLDDPNHVECRAGTIKSHVLLKANLVHLGTAQTATP